MRAPLAFVFLAARLVVGLDDPTRRAFRTQHRFAAGDDQEISLTALHEEPSFTIKSRPTVVSRPVSLDLVQQARLSSTHDSVSTSLEWEEVKTTGPDIEDRHTLAQV
jgi:lipase ATG15